jgi:sec-independent protein translocase protein TatA
MMGLDNPLHIAFLLIVLLMVFGAKRLPELGKSLGSGMRGFKDAISAEASPAPASTLAAQPSVPTAPIVSAPATAAHIDRERAAA